MAGPFAPQEEPILMTTFKHACFVGSPMGQKLVTDVPGIGNAIGQRLRENFGIFIAKQLYGHFILNTQETFAQLIHQCGGNRAHQAYAYNAMSDWDRQHN